MKGSILISAGESSGDNVGGLFCKELKTLSSDFDIFGLGGTKMQDTGAELLFHINDLSFLGFWEVLKHLPFIKSVERKIIEEVSIRKPSLAVLIDYPGFNLRLARSLKSMGVKILYYVSPQVWAWGKNRISRIKDLVDKMIVVFEFEKKLYADEGFEVEYFGHPLQEIVNPKMAADDFRSKIGLNSDERYIGIFPGSRLQEVRRILPAMRDAVERLAGEDPTIRGFIGAVPGIADSVYREAVNDKFQLVRDSTYDLMANAELNLVASGTATLECAMLGRPLFVLYKTSLITYLIARSMVKIPDIGLVNVVAGKRIVPEFVQFGCSPEPIMREMKTFLYDSEKKAIMLAELAKVKETLGGTGASRRAAEFALNMINSARD